MNLSQLMDTMLQYRKQFENSDRPSTLSSEFAFFYSQLWPKNIKIVYHFNVEKVEDMRFSAAEIKQNFDIKDEKSFPKLLNKTTKTTTKTNKTTKKNNINSDKNDANGNDNDNNVNINNNHQSSKKDIDFSHLDQPNITLGPILLYCYKQPAAGRFEPIHAECNGVVIDYKNWKVLVRPPPTLTAANTPNFMSNRADIDQKFENGYYEMSEVEDGSMISFYINPYNNEWFLSTARGFNVKNLKWISDLSYGEAFVEIMKELGVDFGRLCDVCKAAEMSITFNLKHPFFHPTAVTKSLTFLSAFSAANHQFISLEDIKELKGKVDLPVIIDIDKFGKDMSAVLDTAAKAIVKYCDVTCKIPFKNLEERQKVKKIYGFILRKKGGSFSSDSAVDNIFIESSILSFVRKAFYEIPKFVDHKHRFSFIKWTNFLSSQKYKQTFLQLFPFYSDTFYMLNGTCKNIINDILNRIRAAPHVQIRPYYKNDSYKALIDALMNDLGKVSAFDKATSSLVTNLVYDRARSVQYAAAFSN